MDEMNDSGLMPYPRKNLNSAGVHADNKHTLEGTEYKINTLH